MTNKPVDLNALRRTVLDNQDKNDTNPLEPSKSVMVTKNGRLVMGDEVSSGERNTVSRIPQDTFHGRRSNESSIVSQYLPSTTRRCTSDEGVEGWLYSFKCEYGIPYTMFAYFDGSYYQVMVIEPEVEEQYRSAHTGHIFSNGRICFGHSYNNGMPTLQGAYSKSVLWATGMSSMLLSGDDTFPFSINNHQ